MAQKVTKNKPVGGHKVDLLLECGHVKSEPCEAAIYLPKAGETRNCETCKTTRKVQRVGGMYWVDKDDE